MSQFLRPQYFVHRGKKRQSLLDPYFILQDIYLKPAICHKIEFYIPRLPYLYKINMRNQAVHLHDSEGLCGLTGILGETETAGKMSKSMN